ncbi:MAG: hypothetical protein JWN23_2491 [Rhodocyclales bacterium]|nr:hypothetical protein [Rhodocyclales bacterium]
MAHFMTPNALTFESDIHRLVALGDLDGALAFIRFLVDHVRFDPAAMGVTLGSPALDRLCGQIGAATLAQARQDARAQPSSGYAADIILLATELYPLGGHSRVIADMMATRPDKRHLLLLSDFFGSGDRRAAESLVSDNAQLAIAPPMSRVGKLLWLQTELARHPDAQVFVFNHHADAAVVAAIQPQLNREVVFCHHADYHLCLGTHLSWTRHVDFFAPCHHRCSEAGIVGDYWPLSMPDRGTRSHEPQSFGQGAALTSCTSGVWSKFDEAYAFNYVDVIIDVLETTGGQHLHIGGIPDEALARIHAGLASRSIPAVRFQHLSQVPSVWDALLTHRIDLYISSFPLGGGRAITEALGAGIPLITHRHHLEPLLGACGLGPPDTWSWSTPRELLNILAHLTSAELARRSQDARLHYLQHHSPAIFAGCVRNGESAKLPIHVPQAGDRLVSYLLRSAVRSESHGPVLDELHKRLQAITAASAALAGAPRSVADAVALYDDGKIEEAGAAFAELHERQPTESQILVYLGLIALRSSMPDDACVFFDHAVACSQDTADTLAAISQRCLEIGEVNIAAAYQLEPHANAARDMPSARSRSRLRVGFVVGCIAANDVALRLEPLLCELDAERFETLLFFDEIHDATTAQRFSLVVDESHSFSGMDAATAAQTIQARRTDVLVNLEWHLSALNIFSQRAARVQINFSRPPRSSVLPNMDYVLTDTLDIDASAFGERILHLPDSVDPAAYARRFGELLLSAWQQAGGAPGVDA